MNSPVHGLSAGGLLGASCQKQGGGEGVFYVQLPVVRLGLLRAKLFRYWLCLLSSLSSLECFVLT